MSNTPQIPKHFPAFKQRELQLGTETCSTTEYKGYQIFLRAYVGSGIRYTIYKVVNGRKYKLRYIIYEYMQPEDLLQLAINYINLYNFRLVHKLNRNIKI